MRSERRSAYEVTNFIESNTTIKEFYDFVTCNGTNFQYDINDHGRMDSTALHVACLKGNLSLVQALLDMGANIYCQLDNGCTPLYLAIESGRLDLIKLLINNGANLHDKLSTMTKNNAYIKHAIDLGHQTIADYLITSISNSESSLSKKKGLDSEQRDIMVKLKSAVRNNNVDEVRSILNQYHGYIDVSNADLTVHAALVFGNKEIMELLVANGGYVTDKYSGIDGPAVDRCFSSTARQIGYFEVAKYLEDVQASRYKKLLESANRQEKHKIFFLGMFFDNKSTLNNEIAQKAGSEAKNISRAIFRNM